MCSEFAGKGWFMTVRLRLLTNLRCATPTPARECQFEARLMPISDDFQDCTDFHIHTKPHSSITSIETLDGRIDRFSFPEPLHEFSLNAEAVANTYRGDPFDGLKLDEDDSEFYQNLIVREEWEHHFIEPLDTAWPDIDRIISSAKQTAGIGAASFVISLTRLLNRAYLKLTDPFNSQVLNVDNATNLNLLMLQICRRERIPARYVSGCIFNSDIVGEDFMREWVECIMQDGRWHGFDLLANQIVNDRYIKLHTGRNAKETAPLRWRYQGSGEYQLHTLIRITSEI